MNATSRLDPRDRDAVLRELRTVAACSTVALPDGAGGQVATTWEQVLFAERADGAAVLRDPAAPDAALLSAFVDLHAELAAHVSTLPDRLRLEWVERVLGLARRAAVPDRVVVVARADPKRVPVVLPAGTLLRGGKDAAGGERRYATVEPLTVSGASVVAVRSYAARRHATGALTDSTAQWPDRSVPFVPFPAGPDAGQAPLHACRLGAAVLRFSGGSMTVEVELGSRAAHALEGAEWWHSTSTGPRAAVLLDVVGDAVSLQLEQECLADEPAGLPWLEVRLPADRTQLPEEEALQTVVQDVRLRVTQRTGVAVDAASYNDGVLDVGKEFQPFGPVARRGDAFTVRCDEALGKPLAQLGISLELLDAATGQVRPTARGRGVASQYSTSYEQAVRLLDDTVSKVAKATGGKGTEAAAKAITTLRKIGTTAYGPQISWQHRSGGAWHQFASTSGELADVPLTDVSNGTGTVADAAFSEPVALAGTPGHAVRAFLADGDFGWRDYQRRIATFAAAVGTDDADPEDLEPPEPPLVSSMTFRYTTRWVRPTTVTATDGWTKRSWAPAAGAPGPFALWVLPVTPPSAEPGEEPTWQALGWVAVGLEVPDPVLGAGLSLHVEVEGAAACGQTGASRALWQAWDGEQWRELAVADGTRGLRQSGVLRFVAPTAWPRGCAVVGADDGRWLRLTTDQPGRVGTLRSIVPDAVEAEYRSSALDPARDATPAVALAAGEIKGLLGTVPGVTKTTNLAGTRGRAPEDDAGYLRRAAGLVRHRGRAVAPWDYEEMVLEALPEVAAVRCLPCTDADGEPEPGAVGLVVVPAQADPRPLPSVTLAGRITDLLRPTMPLTARLAVLCPLYAAVTVQASLLLARGVPALVGRTAVTAALEARLHPTGTLPPPFGRALFGSAVVAFLESLPEVDHVTDFVLVGPQGPTALVEPDGRRGLVASSGEHVLRVEEQL